MPGHTAPGAHAGPVEPDPRYARLHETQEFAQLKRRYRGFVFPATVAFIAWYALYVVLSMWAHDFMSHKLFDSNINVALVFGLLQFVTTFLIAVLYARYSNRRLDPLARELDERFIREG
jgi:uncharacterized membrane protein (DUF485 family)